ncbi:membrane-bound lytic transglycosylase F [Pseudoruegeria aquimaris]|uniref:Membrane-bound lytic transglycosylase F n=1 Tax=Pseudoruegeria aquimaris TaxID=393663 RepID=A0A1Y5S8Z1_9RHOB|nr:lytic transglycosylase domain-containing protein [Pseudoruegeria aquimaris]SLN33778.1 membrane-bound lytic transglycosylase F [Pseudoruegeria aquimaris]
MRFVLALLILLMPVPSRAEPPERACTQGKWGHVECIRDAHFTFDTCQLIESAAARHGLDAHFFARLIWQESRFDPNAVSPANALGIAQFIPSTAKLRGLSDPFNPAEALEHSAEYLGELQRRFGNPGLAAVAYNGGENRAERFVAGRAGLASETAAYVRIITARSAETWRDAPPDAPDFRLDGDTAFAPACHAMARKRALSPPPRPVPRREPFGVQLAYGVTPEASLRRFRQNTRRCAAQVAGEEPDFIFVKNRVSPVKGYYMARIGRGSLRSASTFCNSLRRAGCICAVFRN